MTRRASRLRPLPRGRPGASRAGGRPNTADWVPGVFVTPAMFRARVL